MMVDPVVSSKYGNRPLLEMPALHVESGTRLEVSSLQPRHRPEFGTSPNLIYRSDGLNQRQKSAPAATQNPAGGLPQSMALALPVAPSGIPAPQQPGSLFAPPPGQPQYQPSLYQQPTMMPQQMMNASPMGIQAPSQPFMDGSAGSMVPAQGMVPTQGMVPVQGMVPTQGMVPAQGGYQMPPMQLPPMFPAMQNPYPTQGYCAPAPQFAPQAMMPQYMQAPPPHTPFPDNFRIEGVLEFGELTTIHFKDKTTNFKGLPEFLRRELQKTYGKFPATDIRITATNGEFHVYATPRDGDREEEDFSDGDPARRNPRMIGFNEVRGEPREFTRQGRWKRTR